jgi:hypothetical protein
VLREQLGLEQGRIGDLAPSGTRPGLLDHVIAGAVLLHHLHRFLVAYSQRLDQTMTGGGDQPAVAESWWW